MSEEKTRMTFAEMSTASARDLVNWLLENVNEIRSVAVVVDYYGDLNNAAVPAIVCAGRDGLPKTAAEIAGMSAQLLKLQQLLLERLHALRETHLTVLQEVVDRHKKLEETAQENHGEKRE